MTPKEKAKELINKYAEIGLAYYVDKDGLWDHTQLLDDESAKQCALIAVDEIIKSSNIKMSENDNTKFVYTDVYWTEVKTELENL